MRRTRSGLSLVALLALACAPLDDASSPGLRAGEGEGERPSHEGEGESEVPRPARYLASDHSPLSAAVLQRLQSILATNDEARRDVFAKVGDSNTVNAGFLRCFATSSVDGALEETRAHFAAGDAAGTDPFRRSSAAATVGWSAFHPLSGDPRPLDVELDALTPTFAVVMFGTNDIQRRDLAGFADDMAALGDALVARGVVPLFSSVPPRDDDADADAWVPLYNLVTRMVAEERQLPFMDLERRLRTLDGHGLGGDGIHLTTSTHGACAFDEEALRSGQNQRNLLTLEALDRVKRAVVDGAPPDDDPGPPRQGTGTADDPFVIDALPFSLAADTAGAAASSSIDAYACAPQIDESGPELFATLVLSAPTRVRVQVLDADAVDVDLHLLSGEKCLARDDSAISLQLDAGAYTLVFDTFQSETRAGAFHALVVGDAG